MHLLKVALILLLVGVVGEIDSAKAKPTTKKPEFTRDGTKDHVNPKNKVPLLKDGCPGQSPTGPEAYQHRIANGRFYIIHHRNRYLYTPPWPQAWDLCKNLGMKLAKVDHLTTFWHIMNYWRTHQAGIYKDTWYWIAARYDIPKQAYVWWNDSKTRTGDVVKYGNYFYRNPRPTGIGAHRNFNNKYVPHGKDGTFKQDKKKKITYNKNSLEQCLTLAFPWPINDTTEQKFGTFGFNPTIDERACENEVLRHAICEADEKCSEPDLGPYFLTEQNKEYFDDGNFIVGNRLYIYNWKQRDFKESKQYCEDLGLELYNPLKKDRCLIPFLKLWARNVSTSQWWTSWKYQPKNWTFSNVNDKLIHNYSSNQWTNTTDEKQPPGYFGWNESVEIGRSNVFDKQICVALSHHYEFKSQMHCPDPARLECQWHYLTYAPANCNNYHGVICQHKDNVKNDNRRCKWRSEWIQKKGTLTEAIKENAMVPFGFETNVQYLRSRYKQTFGSLYCPSGYSMVRKRNTVWHIIPEVLNKTNGDEVYKYDYQETYWVVDEQKFKKPVGSRCTISTNNRGKTNRYTEPVPCTQWHFYLCKKRFKPPIPPNTGHPEGYTEPQWSWNNQSATPRLYTF